eukprot:4565644-Amphidinium_carterae.1
MSDPVLGANDVWEDVFFCRKLVQTRFLTHLKLVGDLGDTGFCNSQASSTKPPKNAAKWVKAMSESNKSQSSPLHKPHLG